MDAHSGARDGLVAKLLRPGISVRVGASLFIGGAFCSVDHDAAAALRRRPTRPASTSSALFELVLGLLAWSLSPERARTWSPVLFMVGGVIVVSGSFYFNGERVGGPATLTEIYYMWPALYAGYFLSRALDDRDARADRRRLRAGRWPS